jgi:hypothetical protein
MPGFFITKHTYIAGWLKLYFIMRMQKLWQQKYSCLFKSAGLMVCLLFLLHPAVTAQKKNLPSPINKQQNPFTNTDTIPVVVEKKDTTTEKRKSLAKEIKRYMAIMRNRQLRDSLLRKITRQDKPAPVDDSTVFTSLQKKFTPYTGKIIRNYRIRQIPVFGNGGITDTVSRKMNGLTRFANNLHTTTRQPVLKKLLFLEKYDTVTDYILAENERFIRNQPYINDARIYINQRRKNSDSVDITIVTKDVFEYGGSLSNFSPTAVEFSGYNNNVFGAGQTVSFGARWDKNFSPQWHSQAAFIKRNLFGSFIDAGAGYSTMNNQNPIDSGVYERSYFVFASRPFYSSFSVFTGGLNLALNSTINVYSKPDSAYRNYSYSIADVWLGLNIGKALQQRYMGSEHTNSSLQLRYYILNFSKTPTQFQFIKDPVYNNRNYILGRYIVFKQKFAKTNYLFGYGRTEDIALGYNASISIGYENWLSRKRIYNSIEAEYAWLINARNILIANAGLCVFRNGNGAIEDDVIQANLQFYSGIFHIGKTPVRQFAKLSYLGSNNPVFYKPLSVEGEFAIEWYRGQRINAYKRAVLDLQTFYYSQFDILGFKFNFFNRFQTALMGNSTKDLFTGKIYHVIAAGVNIRNEHLPLNSIQIAGKYLSNTPQGLKPFIIEIKTITDFRFNIYAIRRPELLRYQ